MSSQSDLLKNTFSRVITDYEAARPTYPIRLKERIELYSGIQPGAVLLEVGVGTGQATGLFLEGGYSLDLLEVSGEQAQFLRDKYRGYPEITVKQGGTLAVFWHMSSVTRHVGGVFDGLNAIRRKYMPDADEGFDEAGVERSRQKRIDQIRSGGCFGMPEMHEFTWTDIYDAERYATLINTYSDTQLLDEAVRMKYLDEIRRHILNNGGRVEMPQRVMLYLVRK